MLPIINFLIVIPLAWYLIYKLRLISCWQKMYVLINSKINLYHMSIEREPYYCVGYKAM